MPVASRHIAPAEDDAMPNGTASEWEKDWREGVNVKLDALTVLVQGLVSRMTVNEQVISDMRDKPANARNWSALWIMLAGFLVSTLCGGVGLAISVINLIASHWH